MGDGPYSALGGDAGVRRLVDDFYDAMESRPDCRVIRELHPADLTESRQKLYEFLSGWTGGPALYWERRGHPRLRRRHVPFPIGEDERDQWMRCMVDALAKAAITPEQRELLTQEFAVVAERMRNR